MRKLSFVILFSLLSQILYGQSNDLVHIKAVAPEIKYFGRTLVNNIGDVTFDWAGTYFGFDFIGESCSMKVTETGVSFYNVFLGDTLAHVIRVSRKDTNVVIASGLNPNNKHRLKVQKRSEGEFGKTTIHHFILPKKGRIYSGNYFNNNRFIEFIGDSYTAGYGTDGNHRDDPFFIETENANKTYACIIARYFNSDYALIAHSGRGAVRNYGDPLTQSKYTMKDAMMNTLNSDTIHKYNFNQYKPSLVVVNLGTNDFSTKPYPSEVEFHSAYKKILANIRNNYGEVPVLCVVPRLSEDLEKYIKTFAAELDDLNLHITASLKGVFNDDSDMGAAWHPGYSGQKKMAMFIIPYISTILGWELQDRPVQ
ncbi:SGNH/GDSL hydrolase family protein [Pseudopedobacter beijingensis]|uniref:GDSL-type esterase/lipase family protein n=1 Tax=Pseudopedobacter beijingensis TaxID=1207056 RepID=A0ABW4IBB9_9SPHI